MGMTKQTHDYSHCHILGLLKLLNGFQKYPDVECTTVIKQRGEETMTDCLEGQLIQAWGQLAYHMELYKGFLGQSCHLFLEVQPHPGIKRTDLG